MINEELFKIGIDPEEIANLLRQLDEKLLFRSALGQTAASANELHPPSLLMTSTDLISLINNIRELNSPYFFTTKSGIGNMIRRLLNIPLKIFGRKQYFFNNDTLTVLQVMADYINALVVQSRQNSELNQKINKMESIQQGSSDQYNALELEQKQHSGRISRLGLESQQLFSKLALVEKLADQIKSLDSKFSTHDEWLKRLGDNHTGLHNWVDLINRKQQMIALDVREGLSLIDHEENGLPVPRIVDRDSYAKKLSEMGGSIKINLGCGEKPLPGYLNVDKREVPDVDIVADSRKLPFEDGSLFEIMSAHLVEHFREHHFRKIVLPYWKQLLIPQGMVRVVCPNWEAMLQRLNDGRMSLPDFKLLTFGGQDYDGDDHFAMYTPGSLSDLLLEAGFDHVNVLAVDRMNGLCPEMEVVAYLK